jgi:hypothetical protein
VVSGADRIAGQTLNSRGRHTFSVSR